MFMLPRQMDVFQNPKKTIKFIFFSYPNLPILVITVAHNPLRATRVPVFTNHC